jgi:peptide/nickel transport system substrate-binding protein
MNAIFGGLFQLTADDDGSNPRIVGILASGYEIANEGHTLIIHLREGVRFSDGTPLDAEAVRFNIERNIEAPCSCAPIRWPWADNDRVVVMNERTVALNFSRPYPAVIHNFPVMNVNWPASPTALAAMGEDEFKMRPVGAGPFKVVSNQLSTRLVLERNPDYWESDRPFLDRLVFQSIASEQAAYLALLAGDAQIVEGVVSPPIIEQAMTQPELSVTRQPATATYLIQLNTRAPPFDDERARQAIHFATDVDTLRAGLFKDWYPVSQSFTGPGGLFHHERIPGYREYDPEKARALVNTLGGIQVRLGTNQSFVTEQMITALQSQWQLVGIDTEIKVLEVGDLVNLYQSGDWQALLQRVGSYDPESGSGVALRFGSGQALSGVADAALDQILLNAAASIDEQARDALYFEAARHISDNAYAPFLITFAPTQLAARGVSGPGLTTRIPPIAFYSAIAWQDVRLSAD